MAADLRPPDRYQRRRPLTPRRSASRTGPGRPSAPGLTRATAHRHEVRLLRLVQPALGARHCAIRSMRRWRRCCTPPGTVWWPSSDEYLDEFWDGADVEVDGDDEVQQAVRFGLFHTLQAGARSEGRAVAAKGLTGPGYDGHSFWDSEMFVLPVLTATAPTAAADALDWRYSIIDLAVERAQTLGHRGAPPSLAHHRRRGVQRRTGRPVPPPSTSTPTSPSPPCGTCSGPVTTTSTERRCRSWSRPPGCG